jgi:TRAP transporter 4TM/12TM fusion protein
METDVSVKPVMEKKRGLSRYYFLPWPMKIIFVLGPIIAMILFILHWFSVPVFGRVLASTFYFYCIYSALVFNVFMGLGATRKQKMQAPPWFDYVLGFLFLGCNIYFLINADIINDGAWNVPPGPVQYVTAIIVGLLAIEAGRRIGGWPMVAVKTIAVVYLLTASLYPEHTIFYTRGLEFREVIGAVVFGAGGMLGIPARLLAELILGFYMFAGMMMGLGGGEFFLKLATAIAGHMRGGPAKVAVISSGFFGSLSGSIVANIAGTGAFTIPAMKRLGYSPEYAGAIETCASSGGDTMPPIMGGVAFLMVTITDIEYADIMIAAFIPTILHYFCLLVQVDSYAVCHNIKGLPRAECPPLGKTLLEGWIFIVIIGFLILGLVYFRWGAITPIYAIGLTIVLQFFNWLVKKLFPVVRTDAGEDMALRPSSQRAWGRLVLSFSQAASLMNFGAAVFVGIAFVFVGLVKTGFASNLTGFIAGLGGESIYLILLIAMVFCLLMGMVGLQRAAYLFMAVTMAPGLVAVGMASPELAASGGISLIAVHLFLIFYIGVGGFTPPVAIHAFIAAGIAGAHPMKTAWISCRLGIVMVLVPFFFVLQPALLILDTVWWDVLLQFVLVLTGIWFLSSGLECYIIGAGKLDKVGRVALIIGGFLFAFPQWTLTAIGAAICIAGFAYTLIRNRAKKEAGYASG